MNKLPFWQKPFSLCTISSLLLWLSWQISPIFLFVAFVPLLWVENYLRLKKTKRKTLKTWGWAYYTFLMWNMYATGWIAFGIFTGSGLELLYGAIFAVTINSWLMTFPFMFFSFVHRKGNNLLAYSAFVVFWLTFEYLHLNWELSWAWLNLGNPFAYHPMLIQWYEYTGTLGGTCWVLMVNVWIYLFITTQKRLFMLNALAFIAVPILISLIIWFTYQEEGKATEIVVVQPNIDPYNQKFVTSPNFIPYAEQAQQFVKLAQKITSPQTQLIALPETAIDDYMEEKLIISESPFYPAIEKFKQLINAKPKIDILTGITSFSRFNSPQEASRRVVFGNGLGWYETYNTALFLSNQKKPEFYHKSKLVPGVEALPYPDFFKLFGNVMINLGGTTGGVAEQKERVAFLGNNGIRYAPLICYESIFGEFTTEYVKKGANILVVITNDAWWGNSSGHKQHFQYARLRAIETRRAVAQSANTGTSGFIDQKGNILQKSDYWVATALKDTLKANTKSTFYTLYGDWIGKISTYLSVFLLLIFMFIPAQRN